CLGQLRAQPFAFLSEGRQSASLRPKNGEAGQQQAGENTLREVFHCFHPRRIGPESVGFFVRILPRARPRNNPVLGPSFLLREPPIHSARRLELHYEHAVCCPSGDRRGWMGPKARCLGAPAADASGTITPGPSRQQKTSRVSSVQGG